MSDAADGASAILRRGVAVWRRSRRAEQPSFRSRVEAVEVDVAVTRGGATVSGLTANNFVVTDNGVVQNVTAALLGAEPLRLTLVLDVSKSVSGSRLASLIKAGRGMVQALRPEDQASLITFSHQVALRVPMSSRFGEIADVLAGSRATAPPRFAMPSTWDSPTPPTIIHARCCWCSATASTRPAS